MDYTGVDDPAVSFGTITNGHNGFYKYGMPGVYSGKLFFLLPAYPFTAIILAMAGLVGDFNHFTELAAKELHAGLVKIFAKS